jgi:hypothetical protein
MSAADAARRTSAAIEPGSSGYTSLISAALP